MGIGKKNEAENRRKKRVHGIKRISRVKIFYWEFNSIYSKRYISDPRINDLLRKLRNLHSYPTRSIQPLSTSIIIQVNTILSVHLICTEIKKTRTTETGDVQSIPKANSVP